jgi:hypothetical protein
MDHNNMSVQYHISQRGSRTPTSLPQCTSPIFFRNCKRVKTANVMSGYMAMLHIYHILPLGLSIITVFSMSLIIFCHKEDSPKHLLNTDHVHFYNNIYL